VDEAAGLESPASPPRRWHASSFAALRSDAPKTTLFDYSEDRHEPGTFRRRSINTLRGLRALRSSKWFVFVLALSLGLAGSVVARATGFEATGSTTRVSLTPSGGQANGVGDLAAVSADGRYVAFYSSASNLVADDNNGAGDVFVRDRTSNATMLVSVADDGTQIGSNSECSPPAVSGDGRFVAFCSDAANLVTGDTNRTYDVFVRDTWNKTTRRVSVATDGTEGSTGSVDEAMSADGRYVAFASGSILTPGDTNGTLDVFVRDTLNDTTTRVSIGKNGADSNNYSGSPSISADGHHVAFYSAASNLVDGDTNSLDDVFVRDIVTGETRRASVATDGTQATHQSVQSAVSGDGTFVAFWSNANNLVAGDTNSGADVFVRDTAHNTTTRVSVATDGSQGNRAVQGATIAITQDGRYVVFGTASSTLVAGDTNDVDDIFVRDRLKNETARLSVSTNGTESNGATYSPALSSDGRVIAFMSYASNLVDGDTNGVPDVFTRTRDLTPLPPSATACASPTISGTDNAETITGTPGADVIDGHGGNDTINGLSGDDVICGGDGGDILYGGTGNDTLVGGPRRDKCIGGAGTDSAAECEATKSVP
jgi:Ca2+-binding RTX toxin-like protein